MYNSRYYSYDASDVVGGASNAMNLLGSALSAYFTYTSLVGIKDQIVSTRRFKRELSAELTKIKNTGVDSAKSRYLQLGREINALKQAGDHVKASELMAKQKMIHTAIESYKSGITSSRSLFSMAKNRGIKGFNSISNGLRRVGKYTMNNKGKVGLALAGTAVLGYGAKKLYDRYKNKDKE